MLLEQIVSDKARGVVFCRRVRTSSLRKGEVFYARRPHHRREAHVSFDAARLVINPILLVALFCELLLGGPWLCPHGRIFDRDDVFERGRNCPPSGHASRQTTGGLRLANAGSRSCQCSAASLGLGLRRKRSRCRRGSVRSVGSLLTSPAKPPALPERIEAVL